MVTRIDCVPAPIGVLQIMNVSDDHKTAEHGNNPTRAYRVGSTWPKFLPKIDNDCPPDVALHTGERDEISGRLYVKWLDSMLTRDPKLTEMAIATLSNALKNEDIDESEFQELKDGVARSRVDVWGEPSETPKPSPNTSKRANPDLGPL